MQCRRRAYVGALPLAHLSELLPPLISAVGCRQQLPPLLDVVVGFLVDLLL